MQDNSKTLLAILAVILINAQPAYTVRIQLPVHCVFLLLFFAHAMQMIML